MKTKNVAIISGIIVVCLAVVLAIFLGNKKSFEVTFDTAGGNLIATETVKKGDKVSKPTDPTKEGYTFDNWYLGETVYDFDSIVTKNITLKARWTIVDVDDNTNKDDDTDEIPTVDEVTKYTVTFDSNGGSKVSAVSVEEGKTVSKPTNPTRSGYKFASWQLDGKNYNFSTKVTKNITLKATWTKVTNTNTTTDTTVKVTSVGLSKTSLSLKVGESATLTATVNPSNATNKDLTWTTSNASIATVSNGKVTAVSAGTATITVTADGKTATCTLTVNPKEEPTYTVEYKKAKDTAIEQYYIYIKKTLNGNSSYVSGTVEITTIGGSNISVNVTENGSSEAYVKSVIKTATVKAIN